MEDAARKGWISTSRSLNQLYTQNFTERLDIKATVEPLRDFRIDLTLNKNFTENHSEYFKNNNTDTDPIFEHLNGVNAGTFSISYNTIGTLFDKLGPDDISETFRQFEDNRKEISQMLGQENPFSEGVFTNPVNDSVNNLYAGGFGPYSQDVLIPAFVSAYTLSLIHI